jgi:hypothetical protein
MFLFSFKKTLISSEVFIRLRLPVVSIPQREKILSTYACEAGAVSRSSAMSDSLLYVDFLLCQNIKASVAELHVNLSAVSAMYRFS